MKMNLWIRACAAAAALGVMHMTPVLAQQAAQTEVAPPANGKQVDRAQVEKRIESVSTLLEKSSAARQVEASKDPRALEQREKARQMHKSAVEAFNAGDLAGASRLLQSATAAMFEGVRFAAPEQVTAEKGQKDFDARVESVRALLSAQKRISAEKSDTKGGATTRNIEKLLTEASDLARAGKVEQGRAVLDRAYLIAKAAIGSMRSGDTLVRSLKFATKEEEYHYELDRNDTHQMLIKVLLEEKRGVPEMERMTAGFVEKAHELRRKADAAAKRGDFEGGIRSLEESTGELVRAIRNAGIYIPG